MLLAGNTALSKTKVLGMVEGRGGESINPNTCVLMNTYTRQISQLINAM